jgi:hypothetical protein
MSGRVVPEFELEQIREVLEGPYRIIYYIKPDQRVATVGAFPTVGFSDFANPRLIGTANQPWLPCLRCIVVHFGV